MAFLADLLVILHLAWVLFMVAGIAVSLAGVFLPRLLQSAPWRYVHLGGLLFSAALGIWGRPCPLTTLEYALRRRAGIAFGVEQPLLIRIAEALIFPAVDPLLLSVVTSACAIAVLAVFFFRPPWRGRESGADERRAAP